MDHNTLNLAMNSFAKLLDDRLETFAQSMSQQSGNKMEEAIRKAKRETFLCKGKGNQQQLGHCIKLLDKIEDSIVSLADHSIDSIERAKRQLEEGAELLRKRVKAIKLADKSEFGWATVSEYLSDDLASNSDDEKRIYRSERRAEKKIKGRQRARRGKAAAAARTRQVNPTNMPQKTWGSVRRLGPCFKISI